MKSTFKKYKKIKSALSVFPGVRTYKEFDILIEIGYHQELGYPLTVKQLLLLDIASQATVRRYLISLVETRMVKKVMSDHDHRSITLSLPHATVKMLNKHLLKILEHLKAIHEEVQPEQKKKKA